MMLIIIVLPEQRLPACLTQGFTVIIKFVSAALSAGQRSGSKGNCGKDYRNTFALCANNCKNYTMSSELEELAIVIPHTQNSLDKN